MLEDEETDFQDVLEKYYCPEISEDERVSIHGIIRDLKITIGWNVDENESLFDKEKGAEIFEHLMTQFQLWRSNILVDFVGLQDLVLHKIARICVFYWIRNSEIVSELLRLVYNCDGHFSCMFAHIVNQDERRLLWLAATQETTNKLFITMVFFLTHSHSTKQVYSGIRFVDLRLRQPVRVPPVFLAAIYNKPQLLLLLLRHGALVDRRSEGGLEDDWDLNMLLRHLIRTLWAFIGTRTQSWDPTIISSTANDECLCLMFLLRVIRQIPVGELKFFLMIFEPRHPLMNCESHDFIRFLSERTVVPKLVSRYFEPSELRHLCRIAIRSGLNRNWNLPFGIFSLPLPKVLQRYVNLSDD